MKPLNTASLRCVVEEALDAGDFDAALRALLDAMTYALHTSVRLKLLNFGSPEVDDLCQLVGRRYLQVNGGAQRFATPPADPPEAELDIYVASHLYRDGGHTALIGDFIKNSVGRRALLLVTNFNGAMPDVEAPILVRTGLDATRVLVCECDSLVEKLGWLVRLLARYRPDRVFLFNHFQDSTAIAAVQPSLARRFYFVHHTNRNPCFGVFLPGVLHIDLMPFTYECCRHVLKIGGNLFVPLAVEDQGCRDLFSRRQNMGQLVTASCGSSLKFRLDFSPNYFDVIARVLSRTGGQHIHIGDLPKAYLKQHASAMKQAGIPDDRFVHVPYVPSLWKALDDYEIDLYINSFPIGGARASVEVMGSGTPAVWYSGTNCSYLHDVGMSYPGAYTWSIPDELIDLVGRIDVPWLRQQSVLARDHYERTHHPSRLADQLGGSEITDTMVFPTALVGLDPTRPYSGSHNKSIPGTINPAMVDLDELLALQ